ncbi:MAG TPA: DUF2442 domain-containing protein [Thermoanaerobaculia bacterium]|nr:DUF2442 domain-containing protein [Thermoanaerobaculia bacterium]
MPRPKGAPEDRSPRVAPTVPWRVVTARALPGYRLLVRFVDGTEGEVHLSRLICGERAGVFAALREESAFEQVDVRLGAVVWPRLGVDLAPDAIYDAIKVRGRCVLD